MKTVNAWTEKITIPTYGVGKPDKNPMFFENRVYQGSSGVVYPNPVIEKIFDKIEDKEYLACYLENEYLKIMILPELGGRVQMAYDKMKKRNFVYYNEVIKPALVGLTGPWISGGIEFNWPQHHRPSTFNPVDFTIEENGDGSITVWCSEIERMFRTRGMAGFTLHPDKAYLEIKVKLYNRTSQPQTFLWWANPAVAVNDDYQSVFPPDVNAVFDHGKRDVSSFPIARGTYYKVDYSPGTDISKYKNIPVPTSYMAIRSNYDFVGGYENDSKGGLLHVANHHISPGKKQWTWGNGEFGKAWDRNLTDRNGPYIELMCGVYTDNQPDFTWLMPYEEKMFTQYFMPYKDLGLVKNATKDILLNLELQNGIAIIKIYSSSVISNALIRLTAEGKIFHEENVSFNPGDVYIKEINVDASIPDYDYHISVLSEKGNVLIHWHPESGISEDIPGPATAALPPEEIKTIEELWLNGLHLEQYRHASFNPVDYYREGLLRDPGDIRCNNSLGMWFFRRGKFKEAESLFRKAIERQVLRNPNPYDGEALFNLGLTLRYQYKEDEAYEAFYKSVWNAAYMDSGYFQLAQIDASREDWEEAIDTVNRSLLRNWSNHKARHLKLTLLRKKNMTGEATDFAKASLKMDPFNFGIYFELYLLGNLDALNELKKLTRGDIHTYIEISLDYAFAGMYNEAIQLLDFGIEQQSHLYPMALYYKAWFCGKSECDTRTIQQILEEAEKCNPDYCFPNEIESVLALNFAMEINPDGAKAPYYLGNFWYNARQYDEALKYWEKSIKLDKTFPTVFRNLALAYYNNFDEKKKALQSIEKAFELDKNDARVLMELDQLYKKLERSDDYRLEFLEKHLKKVNERDDLYIERINLYINKKDHHKAYDLLMNRNFHPWEGGEGKVTGAYVRTMIGLAQEAIKRKEFENAIDLLKKSKEYPINLGEGKLQGAQENEIDYLMGCAFDKLGNKEEAIKFWTKASAGLSEPTIAWYYNDQQPDTIYYQGLALIKLNNIEEALKRFDKLILYGEKHINDDVKLDYFAVSLPDMLIWNEDLKERNKKQCEHLIDLGNRGREKARS